MKKNLYSIACLSGLVALLCGALTACNVTRTVTTTSQVVQRGDTTTTITSRTVESYDASKRM